MTAVAPPPNVHSVPRSWNGQNLDSMTSELFIPRGGKPHRYPMPQSASTGSLDTHGGNIGNGNWVSSLGGKKKGTSRAATVGGVLVNGNGMVGWPKSDANHVRTNGSISSQSPGPNGIHQPGPILPSQHLMGNGQMQQNGHPQTVYLMLISLNGTFDRKQIPLPYYPEILRIGRQTNAKTTPTPINGYFDSKVLSRQHAEVWADKVTNKVWIRDVKSSNGTFVNGQRLSPENQESEAHELHSEDVLELGIDIVGEDNKTIVHHKVAARVEHAGVGNFDMNFGDIDPMVNGSMMPAHGSNPNLRMRTGSQSSRGGTMQNGNGPAGPAHRQQQIMMAPVSMEMVVKKLNQELYAAKQQSQDIMRTAEVFDLVLAAAKEKAEEKLAATEAPQTNGVPGAKAVPSPAPDHANEYMHRHSRDGSSDESSDGHSTSSGSSKSDRSSASIASPEKMLSLVGELARARKEMETNSARIRDLENALKKEKLAREEAEVRAAQLENASLLKSSTPDPAAAAAESAAQAAAELQQRMEAILQELASVKSEMATYKLRAEAAERRAVEAEQQRDSNHKTLMDTVRQIRADEISRKTRSVEAGSQTTTPEVEAIAETKDCGVQASSPDDRCRISAPPEIVRTNSGIHAVQTTTLSKEQTLLLRKQSAAPYASLLGVVVIGVGLMAVINNWQRGER